MIYLSSLEQVNSAISLMHINTGSHRIILREFRMFFILTWQRLDQSSGQETSFSLEIWTTLTGVVAWMEMGRLVRRLEDVNKNFPMRWSRNTVGSETSKMPDGYRKRTDLWERYHWKKKELRCGDKQRVSWAWWRSLFTWQIRATLDAIWRKKSTPASQIWFLFWSCLL